MATAALLNKALGGSKDIEMAGPSIYSPPWMIKSERIRADMRLLKDKLAKLQTLHKQALLVTFDADSDAQADVDDTTHHIQDLFKRLNAEIGAMTTTQVTADEAPVRQQVQRQLAQALFKLSHEFRKEETRFLNKVEQQKGLAAGSSTGMVVLESGATELVDPGFSLQEIQSVNFSHALAEDRDREIQKIVDTISELAQIIKDLSVLVVEQGTMLDRIDTGIQATAIKIEDGVRELVRAEKSQKQGRMFLCIIVLVVLIVVMLIVVMAKAALKFG